MVQYFFMVDLMLDMHGTNDWTTIAHGTNKWNSAQQQPHAIYIQSKRAVA